MAASAEGSESDPNLMPLLDVVLQLIMFFMITVNFVRTEQLEAKIDLPVAQSAVPQDDAAEGWIYLNVLPDGKLLVPGEDIDTTQKLRAYLRQQKRNRDNEAREKAEKAGLPPPKEANTMVVVSADGDARASKVWEVLNSCQFVGLNSWKIRAMTEKPR